jgi:hypothetical protein
MKQKKNGFIPVKQMTRRFNGINGAGKSKSRFNPGETTASTVSSQLNK